MASNKKRTGYLIWNSEERGTYKRGCNDDPWSQKALTHKQNVALARLKIPNEQAQQKGQNPA